MRNPIGTKVYNKHKVLTHEKTKDGWLLHIGHKIPKLSTNPVFQKLWDEKRWAPPDWIVVHPKEDLFDKLYKKMMT